MSLLQYNPLVPINALSKYIKSEFRKIKNSLGSDELKKIIDNDMLVSFVSNDLAMDIQELSNKGNLQLPQLIIAISNSSSEFLNQNRNELIRKYEIEVLTKDKKEAFYLTGQRYVYSTQIQIIAFASNRNTIFEIEHQLRSMLIKKGDIKYGLVVDYKSGNQDKSFIVNEIGSLRLKNLMGVQFEKTANVSDNGFLTLSVIIDIDDTYFNMLIDEKIGILKKYTVKIK